MSKVQRASRELSVSAAKQEIFRERRQYNQWVNNQTLEDYALRFTAKNARRWSLSRVANTALGAISFLVLEAIGAAITLNYGFDNALAAILIVCGVIFFAGLPICYYAAKYGVDIDLLTRGAGFGYIGSTATSLIYSSFTFIFFALEAAIMAKALELTLGLPLAIGYIVSSLVVIPLVFFGITFISRFQLWTQPIWVVLQILPFIFILSYDSALLTEWNSYIGTKQESPGVDLFLVAAAASVMFSLIAQIGEQVDFLRFLPEKTKQNRLSWWSALVLSGPGWTILGAIKLLAGSFLAVVAIRQGVAAADASDPTLMYAVAFEYVTNNSHLALVLAGIFVVISQLKINVTNAYAGSIAWSNFFSRLTHSHPGRVVWLVFNVCIALLLMELGIYQAFESTLSIYAIVAVSWVGALVSDLVINKPLGLSPSYIEFKRAHLHEVNPVGVGSMIAASAIGIVCYLGVFGEECRALAHFIALGTTFVLVPCIAVATRSKYYIAREPYIFSDRTTSFECIVCNNHYEVEDGAHCPAYEGNICSLCCSIDARCRDSCKTRSELGSKILQIFKNYLPTKFAHYVNGRFLSFIGLLALVSTITGILLALIYVNIQTESEAVNILLEATLWKVFFILLIIAGVISWLFVLAHESRTIAQEESHTQTRRLREEIKAHEETDKQLQIAKELAEAANNAKSRYLTGISHELRTPLNTVLGYAQLLEMDSTLPTNISEQIGIIRRSSAHLADLIEGLLDISKIEAGRLDIHRNTIEIEQLMSQLVNMFSLQAKEKRLSFVYERRSALPKFVQGDEKRLRQILINLLSNAIKFTEKGLIKVTIKYRNQVVEFKVSDTGVGIPSSEMERIFRPFERVRLPDTPAVMGTGLGLTITRLLVDIMGGNIDVENNPDSGVTFSVQLALPQCYQNSEPQKTPKEITGYHGARISVMVVDDQASHRGLINDFLTPLGFTVVEAQNGNDCLKLVESFSPNIFLIDRLMPAMDGASLAENLRQRGVTAPILIVSANAIEDGLEDEAAPAYDAYIVKPIKLSSLIHSLGEQLEIDWRYDREDSSTDTIDAVDIQLNKLPSADICDQFIRFAEIGHISALKLLLRQIEKDHTIDTRFVREISRYINEIKFSNIVEFIKAQTHV